MARSKGQSHSLTIKLGQATAECERLQFRMLSMECVHKKSLATLTNAQTEAIRQLKETCDANVNQARAGADEADDTIKRLRDLVIAYDQLVSALSVDGQKISSFTKDSLGMLHASLAEAAAGLPGIVRNGNGLIHKSA